VRFVLARVLLMILLVAAPARAEVAADLDFAGGVETMHVGTASHPSAVAEAGLHVGYDFASWGIGASIAAVGRTQRLFENDDEEIHADLMLRLVSDDRRVRAAFGFGIRGLTVLSADLDQSATISGVDFAHARLGATVVAWNLDDVAAAVSLDGYVAWTLGCFSGSIGPDQVRDVPATNLRCADTLTSTAVVGLSLGVRSTSGKRR
jgi:hypothetical protein